MREMKITPPIEKFIRVFAEQIEPSYLLGVQLPFYQLQTGLDLINSFSKKILEVTSSNCVLPTCLATRS